MYYEEFVAADLGCRFFVVCMDAGISCERQGFVVDSSGSVAELTVEENSPIEI